MKRNNAKNLLKIFPAMRLPNPVPIGTKNTLPIDIPSTAGQ